ncbi:hypothetical protein [uncultured Parabacteroides sp.]|uniref:hypothetical protein n=1 Tax=uncultured Parabacteroides sp. TaxID=512312 RepID=UPI0025D677C9|nr:hypothetical protein [uncultured Parabacteroides sp.]
MNTMYIGSGDVVALMSKKDSQSHISLLRRFVSGIKPYYNARASPIDALRTGAILEDRYLLVLPDNYFAQYVCVSEEMNVFKCSLDFAKIEKGTVVDFDELKSVYLSDYLEFEQHKENPDALLAYVKKKYKHYYYQVQEQLFCTKLSECNLVFLSVTTYDDDENLRREIQPNEYIKVRILRDEKVIREIKDRGVIFQQIKDCYS